MGYMITHMGKHFTPTTPDEAQIHINDISHALSLICRGNGHVVHFYSVAQHSVNCANEAKARGLSARVQLACLLHDASEAYLGDITRPVKPHLPKYMEIEARLQEIIYCKYLGSPLSEEEIAYVQLLDNEMLLCEFTAIMKRVPVDTCPVMSSKPRFELRAFEDVESEFMAIFEALHKHVS